MRSICFGQQRHYVTSAWIHPVYLGWVDHHSFIFTASHRAGHDNFVADALSRLDFHAALLHLGSPQSNTSSFHSVDPASHSLTQKCQYSLCQLPGPFHSSCLHSPAQRHILAFCSQDNPFPQGPPLLPLSEGTLMRFCTHLADQLHPSSINPPPSSLRSSFFTYPSLLPGLSCFLSSTPESLTGNSTKSGFKSSSASACDSRPYDSSSQVIGLQCDALCSLLPRLPESWRIYSKWLLQFHFPPDIG